ncbi:MAG: sulfite exporter TauE/SafE family protein [Hyphomicrobiaceae bacterium]
MDPATFVVVAAAITVGAAVQAALGFAFGLIAAPVLLMALQSGTAVQVLVVVHLVQSIMLVPGLWRSAPRALLRPLIASSLIGFPLGLLIFLHLDLTTLTLAVGLSLVVFSLLLSAREAGWLEFSAVAPEQLPRWSLVMTGMATGVLTALLVMPGPPVILLNAWMRMKKDVSRSLSLTFFAFCYVMVTLLHATAGAMPYSAWLTALSLAPFVVAGTIAGQCVAARLSEGRFRIAILVVALTSGLYTTYSAL